MEVTGKTLLNSAQNILKNKKQESAKAKEAGNTAETKVTNTELNSSLNAQVLRLQASLSVAQKSHSHAQAQLSYLNSNEQGSPENMLFDNEPLFPSLPFKKSIDEYKLEIENDVTQMAQKLKSLQVEMENVFAFNFQTTPNMDLNADSLAQAKGFTTLDPNRVAKLTT